MMGDTTVHDRCIVYFMKSMKQPEDPYAKGFEFARYKTNFVQLLDFSFVNEDTLQDVLGKPDDFAGLVVTSSRAIEAIERAVKGKLEAVWGKWTLKKLFCLGNESTMALMKLGTGSSFGKECNNATELACLIEKTILMEEVATPPASTRDSELRRPLLFLCGNIRRDELPQYLHEHRIPLMELIVYETNANSSEGVENLIEELNSAPTAPKWLVFFSPAGVETFATLIVPRTKNLNYFDHLEVPRNEKKAVKLAAIGPTTAAAISRILKHDAHAVAQRPTPTHLLDAILAFDGQMSNN